MNLSRRLAILLGLLLPAGARAATDVETAKSAAFATLLARLEHALPQNVMETLLPGASDQELSRLQQTVLKGKPVPWDLALLLRWHNGQKWNAPLSNNDNRRLLSIAEIIDEWSFFKDPKSDFMEPWRES